MVDMVNKPPHYTRGGVEAIEGIAAATADLQGIEAVCTANAIKYLWRWKHKNGVEDLRKARWYLDYLIATLTTPGPSPAPQHELPLRDAPNPYQTWARWGETAAKQDDGLGSC